MEQEVVFRDRRLATRIRFSDPALVKSAHAESCWSACVKHGPTIPPWHRSFVVFVAAREAAIRPKHCPRNTACPILLRYSLNLNPPNIVIEQSGHGRYATGGIGSAIRIERSSLCHSPAFPTCDAAHVVGRSSWLLRSQHATMGDRNHCWDCACRGSGRLRPHRNQHFHPCPPRRR